MVSLTLKAMYEWRCPVHPPARGSRGLCDQMVVGILMRAISIFRSDMSTKLRNARWVWSEEY